MTGDDTTTDTIKGQTPAEVRVAAERMGYGMVTCRIGEFAADAARQHTSESAWIEDLEGDAQHWNGAALYAEEGKAELRAKDLWPWPLSPDLMVDVGEIPPELPRVLSPASCNTRATEAFFKSIAGRPMSLRAARVGSVVWHLAALGVAEGEWLSEVEAVRVFLVDLLCAIPAARAMLRRVGLWPWVGRQL